MALNKFGITLRNMTIKKCKKGLKQIDTVRKFGVKKSWVSRIIGAFKKTEIREIVHKGGHCAKPSHGKMPS